MGEEWPVGQGGHSGRLGPLREWKHYLNLTIVFLGLPPPYTVTPIVGMAHGTNRVTNC